MFYNRATKKIIQPFSYQQSNGSCWITSVHNGLLALLGSSDKIEHFISRMFYVITSAEGTDNQEAEILVKLINENEKVCVRGSVIREVDISETRLRRLLKKRNSVLVADTLSGIHSILLLGLIRDDIIAFDPDWRHVKDCKTVKGCFACRPYARENGTVVFNPYHNVLINIKHFLKARTLAAKDQRFVMGAGSSRFIIELVKM